jgi:ElaB/YqjD/DUF883 family membrane-anchored ribosome-binding protein
MMATRESLTEKVAALENQVVDTVQTAANTLTETVDAVKSFVEGAPEAVSETVENVTSAVKERVKRTFDITSHVQENPWACVGASTGIGFLAGYLFFGNSHSRVSVRQMAEESAAPLHPHPFSSSSRVSGPGFLHSLLAIAGRKLQAIAESTLETATASLDRTVREAVPKLIDEASHWVQNEAHHTMNGNGRHYEPAATGYEG